MTQTEMARELRLSQSSIGMYEAGSRQPRLEALQRIATYFQVNVSDLIGDSASEKNDNEADNTGTAMIQESSKLHRTMCYISTLEPREQERICDEINIYLYHRRFHDPE